jgi:hypothetical protein
MGPVAVPLTLPEVARTVLAQVPASPPAVKTPPTPTVAPPLTTDLVGLIVSASSQMPAAEAVQAWVPATDLRPPAPPAPPYTPATCTFSRTSVGVRIDEYG